ncbi:MAG: hypothetical protein COA78_29940 [Blastopirellula sp.]|nr:MAG: hypothetical protein COA78_29940 [Blastopirellula sp.]
MKEQSTKPKRRFYLRFTLRTLLVVMTAICLLLGWKVNQAKRQRDVVTWIEKHAGIVTYQYQTERDPFSNDPEPEPPGPTWLRNIIGIDFFDEVIRVEFHGSAITELTPLANLSGLTYLNISETQVDDLTPLAKLPHLTRLHLRQTQVRDLTPLSRLTDLEYLTVFDAHVDYLAPLAKLTKLKQLGLSDIPARDVTPLEMLVHLELLEIRISNVSNERLGELHKQLPNLEIIGPDGIHWMPLKDKDE